MLHDGYQFVTLTLNPAWDCTLRVEGPLEYGGVHGVAAETVTAGGKGINVAKTLLANGKSVVVAGLSGAADSGRFETEIRRMGMTPRFLVVPGYLRTNLMIRATNGEMKFNRPGFVDLEFEPECLFNYVRDVVAGVPVAIVSGSLPARFPADVYRQLLTVVREAGCATVLDAAGDALIHGAAQADVIKPNRRELEQLAGKPLPDASAVEQTIRQLASDHDAVIVSDGPHGAWFASRDTLLHGTSPDVTVIDTTGAGDAMLGQFCADYFPQRRLTPDLAARALAAGAAAVEHAGSPAPKMERICELANQARPIQEKICQTVRP